MVFHVLFLATRVATVTRITNIWILRQLKTNFSYVDETRYVDRGPFDEYAWFSVVFFLLQTQSVLAIVRKIIEN